jgi:tetrahydromethanopterin S-methyltransferase subunit B
LESLVIDAKTILVANHKLKHLHYFPDPINEKLSEIEWSHEVQEQGIEKERIT